jgi:hypothetical protein
MEKCATEMALYKFVPFRPKVSILLGYSVCQGCPGFVARKATTVIVGCFLGRMIKIKVNIIIDSQDFCVILSAVTKLP